MYKTTSPDGARPAMPADFASRLEALTAGGRRGEAVEYFMTQGMGMPAEMIAQMRVTPAWPDLVALAHTLVYDTAVMGDNTLPAAQAAKIGVPVLVLAGQSHFAPDNAAVGAATAEFLLT
ncbi:hypothetical protein E1286_07550 [Nonomuraea terrae]|uniref:Alpha/beta hydrolase n=1 Tax=Nonomuraea terrae TaxID=2530383 RepID=A0A4R4Z5E3_9ACTN|nr:hypothetical protein [Nonomuraea terrae]TDD53273.1 hypothetical protein E1286_07550 [Nonomuraea terrae]